VVPVNKAAAAEDVLIAVGKLNAALHNANRFDLHVSIETNRYMQIGKRAESVLVSATVFEIIGRA